MVCLARKGAEKIRDSGNIGRVIGEELGVCVKEGRGDEYVMGNGRRVIEQEDGREREERTRT